KEFATKHLNSTPTQDDALAVFPSLEALHSALVPVDAEGVHPKVAESAWDCLAASCARLVPMKSFRCDEPLGAFARTVLLEACLNPRPAPDAEYDSQFDVH